MIRTQKYYILFYLLLLFSVNAIYAAFELTPRSTINIGTGKINLNTTGSFIDALNEPGSLVYYNHNGGEAIWNKPFQIKELQQTAIAGGVLYKQWGFGAGFISFGNKIYSENVFILTAACTFKNKLNFGVGVNIYQLKIDDYGMDHTAGLNASLRYQINNAWSWVSTLKNFNFPKISKTKESLPQIITSGVIGIINDKLSIATEWEQDIEYEGALKFGAQYSLLNQLLISTGYISNPGQFTAGLSIKLNNIYFEYGTVAYIDLGLFTHQLGIGFNINRH